MTDRLIDSTPPRAGNRHKLDCACGLCRRIQNAKPKPALLRTSRQREFVRAYSHPDSATAGNAAQSAVAAGYSPHSAADIGSQLLKNNQIRRAIVTAMERAGIDADYRARKLREGLEAEATWRHVTREGEVIERCEPDFYARHKHLELAMRASGDFPREEPVAQAALVLCVSQEKLGEEEWNRLVDSGEIAATPRERNNCAGD